MPNPRGPQPRHVDIAIVRDGKPTGRYTVEKGLVTVTGMIGGTKTTQLGGSTPKGLAERLLSEIVSEHEVRMNRKP